MSDVWGKNIQFSIFGESHGTAIGGVISSLPSGVEIDFNQIDKDLKRRKQKAFYTTKRAEADEYEILSGVFNNKTTGAPLAFIIRNTDTKSSDYNELKDVMRPGHSDYPASIKYDKCNDYRGGGHFSGRITAPLVFAGSLARTILKKYNIDIFSHIYSINTINEKSFLDEMPKDFNKLYDMQIPVMDEKYINLYNDKIKEAYNEGNSMGGIIECCINNPMAGIGSPFFESVESQLASMLFSIPAVKGVEFGKGFDITRLKGYDANDKYCFENGKVKTKTNNNGGITGGITNGMPIIFKTAIKPTPSIFMEQDTINISTKENTKLQLKGRHDCCIVPRAVPVVECASALVVLDIILGEFGWKN